VSAAASPGPSLCLGLRRPLADFTLTVDAELPGQGITAVFGPSGAGKTTLLRAIAGLDRQATGRLSVGGRIWQDSERGLFLPAHRRPVGYVFQEADLFAHLNVRANLLFGARRAKVADLPRKLAEVADLLGLGTLLGRRPGTLSGGERRRAAIARALLVDPAVLLLDEPLAGVDAARRDEILPWLERLHRASRVPILYVSHSLDEVARLADHLVVLDRGRVTAAGPLGPPLATLEPPLPVGDEAGVVLEAVIAARDARWHLCRADVAGGSLWLRDQGRPVGAAARVRVLARDVSLALQPAAESSILNVLPAVVDAVAEEAHPALALVRVRIGPGVLLARVTRRSVAALQLVPGRAVWAQVKSAAILD
jgi:molybdate transport system ATP-binding protein